MRPALISFSVPPSPNGSTMPMSSPASPPSAAEAPTVNGRSPYGSSNLGTTSYLFVKSLRSWVPAAGV